MIETSQGDFLILGTYRNSSSDIDALLLKVNQLGDTIWAKTYGEFFGDEATSLQETANGEYSIAGYTENFGAFDRDFYMIQTDSNGNSGCYQKPVSIDVSTVNTTVYSGTIVQSATPQIKHAPFTVRNPSTTYHQVCFLSTAINPNQYPQIASVIPNPFSDFAKIKFPRHLKKPVSMVIYDLTGKMVLKRERIRGEEIELERNSMPNGVYFFQILDENQKVAYGKFAVD